MIDAGTTLLRRLNRVLPDDLSWSAVRRRAPTGFDARFAAIWRRYVYRLGDSPIRAGPALRLRWRRCRADSTWTG